MDKVGHLEDESMKRKERLNALRTGNLKSLGGDVSKGENEVKDENEESETISSFPKPIFRNYNPTDDGLKANILPKPQLIEIQNEIKDQLENGKAKPLIEKEIDLTTLAPQKIDWDLKREAEKRLRVLEKRTQRAIVELIRERIKGKKNTDLAELVSIGARGKIKETTEDTSESSESSTSTSDEESASDEESNSPKGATSAVNKKAEISDEDD